MSFGNKAQKKPTDKKPIKKQQKKPKQEKVFMLQPTVVVLSVYLLLFLSKIIDITLLDRENEYYGTVMLQMMIFLLPATIWARFSGDKYVSKLRLRLPRLGSLPLILSASVLMITGGLLLSILFGGLDSLSGSFSLYDTFISKDDGTVPVKLYLALAYAVLPAICEEFVFRGILCLEYERGGVMRAIVLSSLFFGMLHFNLANLPIYLFAGAVLALVLYATRSLIGAMLAHLLYNLFGLFGQPYLTTLYNLTASSAFFIFLISTLFMLSAALFCGEAARLYKKYLYLGYTADYRGKPERDRTRIRDSYLDVLKAPSAIACFAIYIIAIIISLL